MPDGLTRADLLIQQREHIVKRTAWLLLVAVAMGVVPRALRAPHRPIPRPSRRSALTRVWKSSISAQPISGPFSLPAAIRPKWPCNKIQGAGFDPPRSRSNLSVLAPRHNPLPTR